MPDQTTPDEFTLSAPTGDFKPVPEGLWPARMYMLGNLGTQTNMSAFTGEAEPKKQLKVLFGFELLDLEILNDDGTPMTITTKYTMSLHEKSSLYKVLVGWQGRKLNEEELDSFSLRTLLGKYAQIQIVHAPSKDGKRTYANIQNILPLKGEKPAGMHELVTFSAVNPDVKVFNGLPDYLKRQVEAAEEWNSTAMEELGAVRPKANMANVTDIEIKDLPE